MTDLLVMYAVVGAIAGVLAGLLGVGGGLVIVPMLVFCFNTQHVAPNTVMHLSLGTSMASIIFTSISSFWSHHKRGAVQWTVVRRVVPGILLGTFLGSFVASRMSTNLLKGFFVVFLLYVGTQMLVGYKPKPSRALPGMGGMLLVGNVIGAVSSLVGIGGGTLSVPFLIYSNVPAHVAIGTSAAIGFPIAIAGTAGYLVNGLGQPARPAMSLGFVYLPALAAIVCTSVLTAPLGVWLAHSLPVDKLKRVFAVLLYAVAARMLISLW